MTPPGESNSSNKFTIRLRSCTNVTLNYADGIPENDIFPVLNLYTLRRNDISHY